MANESILKFRKVLQQQYKSNKISKKKWHKELKWITKTILSKG